MRKELNILEKINKAAFVFSDIAALPNFDPTSNGLAGVSNTFIAIFLTALAENYRKFSEKTTQFFYLYCIVTNKRWLLSNTFERFGNENISSSFSYITFYKFCTTVTPSTRKTQIRFEFFESKYLECNKTYKFQTKLMWRFQSHNWNQFCFFLIFWFNCEIIQYGSVYFLKLCCFRLIKTFELWRLVQTKAKNNCHSSSI